jgi:hypothetical protein
MKSESTFKHHELKVAHRQSFRYLTRVMTWGQIVNLALKILDPQYGPTEGLAGPGGKAVLIAIASGTEGEYDVDVLSLALYIGNVTC